MELSNPKRNLAYAKAYFQYDSIVKMNITFT